MIKHMPSRSKLIDHGQIVYSSLILEILDWSASALNGLLIKLLTPAYLDSIILSGSDSAVIIMKGKFAKFLFARTRSSSACPFIGPYSNLKSPNHKVSHSFLRVRLCHLMLHQCQCNLVASGVFEQCFLLHRY